MMLIRQLHLYLGVFIAPSILFFAFTGSLQLFSLHEAHGAYKPPALIEKLGSLHKDQVFADKAKRPAPAAGAAGHHDEAADADADHHHHDADGDDDHGGAKAAPGKDATQGAAPAKAATKGEKAKPFKVMALKWLFLGVAVGLILSTCLGLWMGMVQSRQKGVAWILFAAGAVLPVLLVVL